MKCYEMFELEFKGNEPEACPAQADIKAVFTCGEESWKIRGFYDGNEVYKVRFLPQREGQYSWEVSGAVTASGSAICASAADGACPPGNETCASSAKETCDSSSNEACASPENEACASPAKGTCASFSSEVCASPENEACTSSGKEACSSLGSEACASAVKVGCASHGMVQAEGTHFVYQDGTKYLPFGTTIYALAHQDPELIETTLKTLKRSPFNKVRYCMFPKHYQYNFNEPEFFAFEKDEQGKWDVARPCYAYWKHMEDIIVRLGEMGIESDLILFHPYDRWGFSTLSLEEMKVYLDYALRRLAAYPYVWWSMANEYDIMFRYTGEDWAEIARFISENDPYHHLLSNHNCMKIYDFSNPAITHCCLQTSAMHKADEWMAKYNKPVIFDECCYEGDIDMTWGNISAFEMANRFWKGCTKGAYVTHGETYDSPDEILWWSKGGALKGKSPERIGFLKNLLYELPGALTPWDEPVWDEFTALEGVPGEDPMEKYQHFMNHMKSMSVEESENLKWKDAVFNGHYGDEVYLKYLGNQCTRYAAIRLPKEHTYRIEVIDMWEMTRETVMEEAGGKTIVELPGKEGMAILALKNAE